MRHSSKILSLIALVLTCATAEAGMENCKFAMHWKPKFSPTKTITVLCDNPATTTVEPNYSPNWNSATSTPNPLPCDQYTTSGPLGPSQIYIVLAQAGPEGVCGASFGIDYNGGSATGIDPAFVQWTACADGDQFPNDGGNGVFPKQRGGLKVTWHYPGSCQYTVIGARGVHAVIGSLYVYAYSPSSLQLTPNNNVPAGPELAIDDCRGGHLNLLDVWGEPLINEFLARVDVGGGSGFNSCLISGPSRSRTLSWGRIKNLYGFVPRN
jgi:hypothetical protein